MKRLLKTMTAAVLALAMTLSLAACGAPSPTEQAEKTVAGMFQALKTMDFEAAAKYTGEAAFLEGDLGLDEMPGGEEFFRTMFERVDYQILGSQQEDEDTVFVQTKITAVDMKPVFGQFLAKAMEYAFAHMFDDPAPSDEQMEAEMMKILSEEMAKPDLATVENEVLIEVEKGENGWTVDSSETLVNALLGGLQKAIDELSDAFG